MALLNFPSSPTNGQVYTSANGVSYQYNGTFWSAINTSYATGGFTKLDNISSGFNGSNTTFNLTASGVPVTPGTAQNLIITIGGVTQEPANAYTVSTSTITFTSAPPAGVTFSGVMLGAVMNVGVPSDSTVTSSKLDSNIAVSANLSYGGTLTGSTGVLNIGSGQIYKDTSGNIGIGTSSPNANAKLSLTDATAAAVYFNSTGTGGDTAYFALQKSADGLTFGCENRGFVWKTGSATVLGGTERMRLDASGNLGLGVTPSSNSVVTGFEVSAKGNGIVGAGANDTYLTLNSYYNSGWKYANTGSAATQFRQTTGAFSWFTAPSGTAGNPISFTQAMTLDASGNLGIGTSSPATKLQVTGGSIHVDRSVGGGASQLLMTLGASSGGNFGQISNAGTYWALGYGSSQSTVGTQSVIWDSSGNLLVGTTSAFKKVTINGSVYPYNNGSFYTASGAPGTSDQFSDRSQNNGDAFYHRFIHTSAGGWWGFMSEYPSDGGSPNTGFYPFRYVRNGTTNFVVLYNGNVQNLNNSYGATSDISIKENIVDTNPKLNDILKVRIRNFNLKGETTKQIGVVAQELEEIFPGMVEENADGLKGVKYSVFVPILIKSLQEQHDIILELKNEIEQLKSLIK